MCGRVIEYQRELIYFPNRDARLLVQLNNGNVPWVYEQTARKKQSEIFPTMVERSLTQPMPENGNSGFQGFS